MSTIKHILSLLLAASTGFIFTGCYKVIDYANHHKGDEMKLCRIEKMVFDQNENATATISYNANNDPISIQQGSSALFMPLDYYFRYDQQNRLTDYMLVYYHMTGAMVWHRYSYPDKKTIVDTQFNYVGIITDPPPHSAPTFYVVKYNLDQWGRIIRSTEGTSVANFTYDDEGNLVRPGIAYDHKINILRTSRTWMFIRKDYSMNNPLPATVKIDNYNVYGLPLQYTSLGGATNNELFGYSYTTASVVYACDNSIVPSK